MRNIGRYRRRQGQTGRTERERKDAKNARDLMELGGREMDRKKTKDLT